METQWVGEQFHDTVYITANPHAAKLPEGTFHAVENLLDTDWNDEHRTIMPDAMAERVADAHVEYPNKRIIGHFMQPHFPFIGSTGQSFAHQGLKAQGRSHPWRDLLFRSDVSVEKVLKAYRENYEIVLDAVDDLLNEISGKVVLTSDHGNLIGERGPIIPIKQYGHPEGLHLDQLVTVPWVELSLGERPVIQEEAPVAEEQVNSDVIKDRLQALGYKD